LQGPKPAGFERTPGDTTTPIRSNGLKIVLPGYDHGQDESCESLRFSAILTILPPLNTTLKICLLNAFGKGTTLVVPPEAALTRGL